MQHQLETLQAGLENLWKSTIQKGQDEKKVMRRWQ